MKGDVGNRNVVTRVVVLQDTARVGVRRVNRRRHLGYLGRADIVVDEDSENQAALVGDIRGLRKVKCVRRSAHLRENETEVSGRGLWAWLVVERRRPENIVARDEITTAVEYF